MKRKKLNWSINVKRIYGERPKFYNDPIEREYFRKEKEQILNMSNNSELFGSSFAFSHNFFFGFNQYQAGYQGGRYRGGSGAADYGAHGYGGAGQLGDDMPEY